MHACGRFGRTERSARGRRVPFPRGLRAARELPVTLTVRFALALLVLAILLLGPPALAIRRSEVLADAQSWVDAGVPYSQGRWGSYCSWDYCYEDGLRGNGCYRSDCSGFVSATWGLDAPGMNTWGLCDGSVAREISFDELQPGDAVIKCDQHVMLFRGWIDGDSFESAEEHSCGSPAEVLQHRASSLQASGYIALRLDAIEDDPPPNASPRGSIDGAGCAITGWAEDPDAPDAALGVHLYAGGPSGDAAAVAVDLGPAALDRADLCDALGSCAHGFAFDVPPSWRDGASRPFYAYTFDATEGFPVMLDGSPVTGSCPRMTPPIVPSDGVKRALPALEPWGWSPLDVAPLEDTTVARYPDGPAFPDVPVAVQSDDGAPEVWILDDDVRRLVADAASLTAWRLDAAVQVVPAADLEAKAEGLPWPAAPFVLRGTGDATYVLDHAPPDPDADPAGDPDDPGATHDPGDPGWSRADDGASGGLVSTCTASPGAPRATALLWALLLLAALTRSRRP